MYIGRNVALQERCIKMLTESLPLRNSNAMKQLSYPRRLTINVSPEHGEMLDKLCEKQLHERPACFLKGLEHYFAHVFTVVKRERRTCQRRKAA